MDFFFLENRYSFIYTYKHIYTHTRAYIFSISKTTRKILMKKVSTRMIKCSELLIKIQFSKL